METVTVRMARSDRSTSWGFGVTEAPNRDVVIVNVSAGPTVWLLYIALLDSVLVSLRISLVYSQHETDRNTFPSTGYLYENLEQLFNVLFMLQNGLLYEERDSFSFPQVQEKTFGQQRLGCRRGGLTQ
ncbi:unnamed protein product [Heligmosomoides polygyrus]|uniref:Uncharacterized protein n=1 Tax=Heligmosomoides polygyrus TaxID=6339 RepID=A0A183GFN7_HELPZ|nr:unnamed protein product [Heligmosomoides polygyrus]